MLKASTQACDAKERQRTVWLAIGIGVFVAAFLLLFRPFDMEWYSWRDLQFWLIVGLAPYNTGLILGLDAVFTRLERRWAWLQLDSINLPITVVLVIASNVAYQAVFQSLQWVEVLYFTGRVALVALFPTAFVALYYRRRQTENASAPMPSARSLLVLHDENHRETLSVPADDLLFIAADRNYALIHTRTDERPHLLRTSLKALEAQLTGTSVVRCHRSYLVNTMHIIHRRRHARGLHLTLRNTEAAIPVSPSFIGTIEQRLAQ